MEFEMYRYFRVSKVLKINCSDEAVEGSVAFAPLCDIDECHWLEKWYEIRKAAGNGYFSLI